MGQFGRTQVLDTSRSGVMASAYDTDKKDRHAFIVTLKWTGKKGPAEAVARLFRR
jgi:hypothetical protein